jgi:hypothetical protein
VKISGGKISYTGTYPKIRIKNFRKFSNNLEIDMKWNKKTSQK